MVVPAESSREPGSGWALSLAVHSQPAGAKRRVVRSVPRGLQHGAVAFQDGQWLLSPEHLLAILMDRKLDAVQEAVRRLGTSLDQTRTPLEQKIDIVVTGLNLLHADNWKLVDKTRTMEHTLHKLTPKT
ncbi:hypothetical protein NDU88_006849 [Pleurodeles waltl]|uniref:Uncharacterized protein n=1 Tax=Pleurodeles waltl TaxID=8319 RepID=A0AAV7MG61_PLEWA|nr:hypothetical protein NDU88_006849 [Pleurodeles waltl]